MTDDTDSRAPVTIFNFFLELTRALPVQSGAMHISYVDRDEEWSGWTDADVAGLLGDIEVEASPAGSVPHTSMIARHLTEPEPAPLSRVEAAFDDWGMQGLIPPETPNRPGAEPEPGRATIEVVKSVVALTRFVPQSAHPPGRELTVGALHRIMFDGLVHLNALLEPLGFVAGRWEIGALTLADVPPEVAVLVDNTGTLPEEQRKMIAFVTEIHNGYPILAGDLEDDGSIAREAIGYHGGEKDGGQPSPGLPFHPRGGGRAAGRRSHARPRRPEHCGRAVDQVRPLLRARDDRHAGKGRVEGESSIAEAEGEAISPRAARAGNRHRGSRWSLGRMVRRWLHAPQPSRPRGRAYRL